MKNYNPCRGEFLRKNSGAAYITCSQYLCLLSLTTISGWVRLHINLIIPNVFIQNSADTGIMMGAVSATWVSIISILSSIFWAKTKPVRYQSRLMHPCSTMMPSVNGIGSSLHIQTGAGSSSMAKTGIRMPCILRVLTVNFSMASDQTYPISRSSSTCFLIPNLR